MSKHNDGISSEEMATLYTDIYNLFEGVSKKSIIDHITGKKEDSRIMNRQMLLLLDVVKIIDNNLREPSNLSATLQPIVVKKHKVLEILEKNK